MADALSFRLAVDVDQEREAVTIRGHELDEPALRQAIDEAGYDAV